MGHLILSNAVLSMVTGGEKDNTPPPTPNTTINVSAMGTGTHQVANIDIQNNINSNFSIGSTITVNNTGGTNVGLKANYQFHW